MTGKKCEDCEQLFDGCINAPEVCYLFKEKTKGNQKYDRTIVGKYGTGSCVVDAYRIIDACNITIPQLQHAAKKILFTGERGHKDLKQDLIDILHSTQSALDMMKDKESTK